jgi:hypothetical protein
MKRIVRPTGAVREGGQTIVREELPVNPAYFHFSEIFPSEWTRMVIHSNFFLSIASAMLSCTLRCSLDIAEN